MWGKFSRVNTNWPSWGAGTMDAADEDEADEVAGGAPQALRDKTAANTRKETEHFFMIRLLSLLRKRPRTASRAVPDFFWSF